MELHCAAFKGNLERENAITVHQKIMDRVRELVPKENLLEWKVQDGWGPLCAFLGAQEPEEEFLVLKAIQAIGLWSAAIGAIAGGVWWAMKS